LWSALILVQIIPCVLTGVNLIVMVFHEARKKEKSTCVCVMIVVKLIFVCTKSLWSMPSGTRYNLVDSRVGYRVRRVGWIGVRTVEPKCCWKLTLARNFPTTLPVKMNESITSFGDVR
jgi:hypothetical protein